MANLRTDPSRLDMRFHLVFTLAKHLMDNISNVVLRIVDLEILDHVPEDDNDLTKDPTPMVTLMCGKGNWDWLRTPQLVYEDYAAQVGILKYAEYTLPIQAIATTHNDLQRAVINNEIDSLLIPQEQTSLYLPVANYFTDYGVKAGYVLDDDFPALDRDAIDGAWESSINIEGRIEYLKEHILPRAKNFIRSKVGSESEVEI